MNNNKLKETLQFYVELVASKDKQIEDLKSELVKLKQHSTENRGFKLEFKNKILSDREKLFKTGEVCSDRTSQNNSYISKIINNENKKDVVTNTYKFVEGLKGKKNPSSIQNYFRKSNTNTFNIISNTGNPNFFKSVYAQQNNSSAFNQNSENLFQVSKDAHTLSTISVDKKSVSACIFSFNFSEKERL